MGKGDYAWGGRGPGGRGRGDGAPPRRGAQDGERKCVLDAPADSASSRPCDRAVTAFTLLPESIASTTPWTPPPRQRLAVAVLDKIARGIQAEGYALLAPEEVVEEAGGR